MPWEIYELASSRSSRTGRDPSIKLMFFVAGLFDEHDVRVAVRLAAPLMYESLVRLNTDQQPLGGGFWTASADYGSYEFQVQGDPGSGEPGSGGASDSQPGGTDPIGPHVSISFGGRQQHITQAIKTTGAAKRTSDTRDIPDLKGVIGQTKEGVAGCDILVPDLKWSETWTFNPAFLTWDWVKQLRQLVGRVNLETFRSFPRGEVMFLGGEITTDDSDKARIVYNFYQEENVTVQLNDEFQTVEKKGHQYLDVEYEQIDFPLIGAIGNVPRVVRVHEVGRISGKIPLLGTPLYSNERSFNPLRIGR